MPKAALPLPNEVDLGKGLNPWGFQRKLKPQDTLDLVTEEIHVLRYVEENQPVKLWRLLNDLGKLAGPHKYQSRSQRQKLMPLTTRLCREGKLERHRATNTLRIGPNYVKPAPDLSESRPDLGAFVCDVRGLDRVA